MSKSRWIPFGEICRLLGLSRPTVRKKLRGGQIPGLVLWFGYPRCDREVFENWWESKDR